MNDEHPRDRDKDLPDKDLPGPAEDPDTSMTGSTDTRSSRNRREGLRKEQENAEGERDADRQDDVQDGQTRGDG